MNGYTSVSEIEYAILETNGEISIIPKSDLKPVCPKDFGVQVKSATLHKNIIKDGIVEITNLQEIGKNYNWLNKILKKENVDVNEVFLMSSDGEEYFLQKKEIQ